jgi:hypothetical protein
MTDTINPHSGDRRGGSRMDDGRSRSRRWHRGPKGADLLDLVFKISSKDGWAATLRNNPSVVLVAKDGSELAELTRELALAILQHRCAETLSAMRAAGKALPEPDPRSPEPGAISDEPGEPGQVSRAR